MRSAGYSLSAVTSQSFDAAVERVREGNDTLSEIATQVRAKLAHVVERAGSPA